MDKEEIESIIFKFTVSNYLSIFSYRDETLKNSDLDCSMFRVFDRLLAIDNKKRKTDSVFFLNQNSPLCWLATE